METQEQRTGDSVSSGATGTLAASHRSFLDRYQGPTIFGSSAPEGFKRGERVFVPEQFMAIEPSAMGGMFAYAYGEDDAPEYQRIGQAAVVDIEGPIARKGGWWCEGYDSILDRFEDALQSDAPFVALRIHSPGGMVSGCFESVRAGIALKQQYGKKVIGWGELICSGAYAWACVCDEVFVPASARIGSVGVVSYRDDFSKFNEKNGINCIVAVSGKQKADGNPDVPVSDEELKRLQASVDTLAGQFFDLVAPARRMTAAQVKSQEAAVFIGKAGVDAGLANGVKSFDEVIADLERAAPQKKISTPMQAQGSQGQKAQGASMEKMAFAVAVGLSAEATDQQITERLNALQNVERKLLETTAESDAKNAFVKIDAWRDGHEKATSALKSLGDAQTEIANLRAAETERAWKAKFSEGQKTGAIVPGNADKVAADYAGDLAGLSKFVANAVPGIPGLANEKKGIREGEKKEEAVNTGSPDKVTWQGKEWAALTADDKAALFREDKDLYNAMKASAVK